MTLTDWILIGVLVLVVGGAVAYIIKAKKSGQKCIGCPHSSSCGARTASGGCGGSCACCSKECKKSTADHNNVNE